MARTFAADAVVDGHGEGADLSKGLGMVVYKSRATIGDVLIQMFGIIDTEAGNDKENGGQRGAIIGRMNGFTNGQIYMLEFNIINPNHSTNRIHAGVAAYEMDADGFIKEARVFDEAW